VRPDLSDVSSSSDDFIDVSPWPGFGAEASAASSLSASRNIRFGMTLQFPQKSIGSQAQEASWLPLACKAASISFVGELPVCGDVAHSQIVVSVS
jgi:hypothetical protein